ncbi:MAG: hypothetical protein RH860_09985 [Cytophagales bacterium]|nr:hypothetical protein HZR84_11205 [Hyphobacterium sp. CCMP332]
MVNRKIIFFGIAVILALVSLSFSVFSFDDSNPEQHIMLEIYEVPAYNAKGIHIYYGNNQSEFIPFRKLKEENQEKNGDLIVTTINKLSKEGFEITHVGSGLSNNGMITKIFMTRK